MGQPIKTVYEFDNVERKYFDSDTIFVGQQVKFSAKNEMDTYYWKVGQDERSWDKKEFALYFEETGVVEIMLVTYKEANANCNSAKEYDTVRRKLHIIAVKFNEDFPFTLIGKYEGANTDKPNEKFIITIAYEKAGDQKIIWPVLKGLPRGYSEGWFGSKFYYGNHVFNVGTGDPNSDWSNEGLFGWGVLSENRQELTIEYSVLDITKNPERVRINKTFVGKRIN
ncbi:MAG: hypothetical protein ACXWEY_11440 [Bacteroidia bacterium]